MGHIGNRDTGQWGTRGMGHMGNEAHWGYGVQGYGAIRVQGVWGTRGMGHMANGVHGQWGTGVWVIGHVGNGAHGRFAPKMSKRCQVVKKMSNVKNSNTWTMEEVHKKIKLTQ